MKFDINSSDCLNRIMLFDLSVDGHHPTYIRHLINYWYKYSLTGSLDIVVSPKFFEKHFDVVELALNHNREHKQNTIRFVSITEEEVRVLMSRKTFKERMAYSFREWNLFCHYAKSLKASHSLTMYFDTCQLPLLLNPRSPSSFSGIYFRPSFHYNQLTDELLSRKEKLQVWREKFLLSRILRHPNLKTLFSLDPFAVEPLNHFSQTTNVLHLPDPVQIVNSPESQLNDVRQQLKIEPDRKVFLLFGALDSRKGIQQILDALQLLPIELCQKVCLLLVGQIKSTEREEINTKTLYIREHYPVQIVNYDKYVPELDVPIYFHLADVVLAAYQRHVGMSGILLLAAAAQKPVLSSNYGLMGEMVKRYQLGLAIDTTQPIEIAQGIRQFLAEAAVDVGDRDQMKQFAEQNSAENFAKVIFQNLLVASHQPT